MKETTESPPNDEALALRARQLGQILIREGQSVATAESCTGGWIAKVLTDTPGSSAWFGSGWVSYSNVAKAELLGVSVAVLEDAGAVSEPVVQQMAMGAKERSRATWAVAVSGVAGPGGGSAEKPVGLVWFAWAGPDSVVSAARRFSGDREAVRRQTVAYSLDQLTAMTCS